MRSTWPSLRCLQQHSLSFVGAPTWRPCCAGRGGVCGCRLRRGRCFSLARFAGEGARRAGEEQAPVELADGKGGGGVVFAPGRGSGTAQNPGNSINPEKVVYWGMVPVVVASGRGRRGNKMGG